jgi:pyruvate dehydrogenase E1 component alpha subunit
VLPIQAVIGAHPLHAVGIGYAMKYRGEDAAVVTFFGDGATSQGEVHEALNFAGVWKAPVVFFCINNQWAISLSREQQTASQTIAQKALAYGFDGIQVDGNDVLAVFKATRAALQRARSGGGPTMIEALSYRLMMHTTADDPRRYRENAEVDKWWRRDPIPRTRKYMEQRGMWNEDLEGGLQAKVKREIDEVVRQMEATEIKPDAPFDHLFGEPHYTIERQREALVARIARQAEQQKEGARG